MGQTQSATGQPVKRRFVIPSNMTEAMKVVETVIAEVAVQGYTESDRFAIRLAMDEAVANAVRHGSGGDPSKEVDIQVWVNPKRFRITICDQGQGFSPDQLPDPTLDENLLRPTGRGVMLMKAYMSSVEYNDRGNCVTMVKTRNDGADK